MDGIEEGNHSMGGIRTTGMIQDGESCDTDVDEVFVVKMDSCSKDN